MKLTSKSEYALLALIYLARQPEGEWVRSEQISQAQQIPFRFLQQILLVLKRSRHVRSTKGQQGGYQLARPAGEISIAEIVRLFDGALAPTESVSKYFYESTPIEKEEKMIDVLRKIRDYIADTLEGTTLADMK